MALSSKWTSTKTMYYTAQIPNAGTLSDIINMDDQCVTGIIIPVAHTNNTLSLLGSVDGVTFYPVKKSDGTVVAITTAGTTGYYKLEPAFTDGIPFIQLSSGGAEGAQRSDIIVCADYK